MSSQSLSTPDMSVLVSCSSPLPAESCTCSQSHGFAHSIYALTGWIDERLSARLVELLKKTEGDKVSHTNNEATWHITDGFTKEGDLTILTGNADATGCRWWATILAEGLWMESSS